MQYEIEQLSVSSALKYGLILGAFFGFLNGLLFGMIAIGIVKLFTTIFENLILLGAMPGFGSVLDRPSLLAVSVTMLASIIVGSIVGGLVSVLTAVVYNLVAGASGGFTLQLEASGQEGLRAPAVVAATPQPASPAPFAAQSRGPEQQAALAPAVTPVVGQSQPNAWLLPVVKDQQSWLLPAGIVRIGSALGNEIVIADLAPLHAEIRYEEERYIIYDLGSRQTWINGRPLSGPNMLKPGFRVRLGNHEFLFQREE